MTCNICGKKPWRGTIIAQGTELCYECNNQFQEERRRDQNMFRCEICDEQTTIKTRFARVHLQKIATDFFVYVRIFVCADCNTLLQKVSKPMEKYIAGYGVHINLQVSNNVSQKI